MKRTMFPSGAARSAALPLLALFLFGSPLVLANDSPKGNPTDSPKSNPTDYPTESRVDYVIGCMAANGNAYLTMQKCACSIDVIAEHLSYETYEQVATVLSMQDQRGELGVLFRTERGMQDQLRALHQAQADANLRCF
ncbi:hypothetical protein [Halomonas sp. RA08-2]|uniref:hypothetical protein n=1 Tax=Halomonas sp. RA08-2 TaxID=3440842 RepID=UPI003EEFED3F